MQEGPRHRYALVVEDHPLVADSLMAWVRECDARLEVIVADSLRAAIRTLALRQEPILIVTDLTLTDAQGIEAVGRLRKAAPQSQLLVFTALDEPKLRTEAIQLGAVAYVVKSASIQTLRDAIDKIIGASPNTSATAVERREAQRPLLTPKQCSVLDELVEGRSNKEIAARLNISDQTVNSHMKEILGRLGVRNRTEAVVRYLAMSHSRDAGSER